MDTPESDGIRLDVKSHEGKKLRALGKNLQAAVKEGRNQGFAAADKLVNFALRENDDASPVVYLLSMGFGLVQSEKKNVHDVGSHIIKEAERYFAETIGGKKRIFVDNRDEGEQLMELEREFLRAKVTLIMLINQNSLLRDDTVNIDGFLSSFRSWGLKDAKKNGDLDKKLEAAKKVRAVSVETSSSDEERENVMLDFEHASRTVENIPRILKKLNDPSNPEYPVLDKIFSRKFNGVCLKDLVNEEDVNNFIPLAIEYMKGVPRDDLFWGDVALTMLYPEMGGSIDNEDFEWNPYFDKVMGFQYSISEEMLLKLLGENVDEELIKSIKEISTRFRKENSDFSLSEALAPFFMAPLFVLADKISDPAVKNLIRSGRIGKLVAKECSAFGDGVDIELARSRMSFLVSKTDAIRNGINEFGFKDDIDSSKTVEELDNFVHEHDSYLSKFFERAIQEKLGENFKERLGKNLDDLREINRFFSDKVQGKVSSGIFADNEEEFSLYFSQDSLPEILGIKRISFVKTKFPNFLHFYLVVPDKELDSIGGRINLSNGKIELAGGMEKEYPEISLLLQHISLASAHDLMTADNLPELKRRMQQSVVRDKDVEGDEKPSLRRAYLDEEIDLFKNGGDKKRLEKYIREALCSTGEKTSTFVKGEALEQMVGLILAYAHPDETVLPQFCLETGVDGTGKGYYKMRSDFKVGNEIFEVKWGQHIQNINETISKHMRAIEKGGKGYHYSLIRFQNREKVDVPDFVNQKNIDKLLAPGVDNQGIDNFHARDMFIFLSVAILESAEANGTENSRFLASMRDYLYNVINNANEMSGQNRQGYIHGRLNKLLSLLGNVSVSEKEQARKYMEEYSQFPFSPLEATYEYDGKLYQGAVGLSEMVDEDPDLLADFEKKVITRKNGNGSKSPYGNGGRGNGHGHTNNGDVSGDLSGNSEEHMGKSDAVPKKIGMQKKLLAGVRENMEEYVEAYKGWLTSEDDSKKKVFEARLREIRSFFAQPSKDKVASFPNLPSRFHLDKVEALIRSEYVGVADVNTGQQLYRNTWYVEHMSPKLTDEEKSSVAILYKNRFENRPALEFVDYITRWIVETEEDSNQ